MSESGDLPDPDLTPKSGGPARMVMVLGLTLPLALGAGVALGTYLFGGKGAAKPVPSVVCPKPEPPPAPPVPTTLADKAIAGDYKAIDELKAKAAAQRTPAETLALAQGRSHNRSLALQSFGSDLKKDPDVLTKNKDQLARFKEFLNDRETTTQAAGILVELPGPLGPDLLYDIVASPKGRAETAQLADDLLATKEVREKASPALALTLDMRQATQCEEFKTLLPRAAEVGDRRAIPMLAKLTSKKGCGDTKRDDCYECLRPLEKDKEAIDLVDAIKAAQHRAGPKL
jgi:hypothetical protein